MRRIIAKVADWWNDDRPTLTDSERMDQYAQGLLEPERTMFLSWRGGKTTQQISQEMRIDPCVGSQHVGKGVCQLAGGADGLAGRGFGLRLRTDHGCTGRFPGFVMRQHSARRLIGQHILFADQNWLHPRTAGVNHGSTFAGADEHQRHADEQPRSAHHAPPRLS